MAPAASVPVIANIQTAPAAPAAGETVHVSAEVTDAVATLTAVELRWGTASNSLPNTIAMALQSGDTWATSSPIPAQTAGTTVYFEIEATNDVPASTTSDLQSYGSGPAGVDLRHPGTDVASPPTPAPPCAPRAW